MANDQGNASVDKSQSDAPGGDKTEGYFFGTFKTKEDADAAFKETQRRMHDATSEAARWKEIAERQSTTDQPQPTDKRQSYDTGESQEFLTKLYSDPIGTKKQIVEEAVQIAEDRLTKRARTNDELKSRVDRWASGNRDLDKYQDLLQLEVAKTDARLSPESRLDEAAKHVRTRLADLRGSGSRESQPHPDDYVPGPSGGREDAGDRRYVDSQQPANDPEAELKKMVDSRNSTRFKRPGSHGRAA